jgi:leucine dehydrogenase|tara:strand:- start:9369 stop:10442 length:1074 start_codon:yes stop_codon:yes gene_type:complete
MSNKENKTVFDQLLINNHEELVFCSDKKLGLKAIIGIHDTTLGPSMGGTRMWNYDSEEDALKDVLNLSKAMSYKSSLAGLNAGGGKAVLIGDINLKNKKYIERYADFINDLGGKYWTAQDVNMHTQDIIWIKNVCPYVIGLPIKNGGLGDSSAPTAYGIYTGMKASINYVTGKDSLANKKVCVQGVGNVGSKVVDYLIEEGAEIFVSDINQNNLNKISSKKVNIIDIKDIHNTHYDIFSPCALGGIINSKTVKKLDCKIIAGAANNQLEDDDFIPNELKRKNILYVPDFLINAGGIISVYHEQINKIDSRKVMQMTESIYDKALDVFKYANDNNTTTHSAAIKLAKDRIQRNKKNSN